MNLNRTNALQVQGSTITNARLLCNPFLLEGKDRKTTAFSDAGWKSIVCYRVNSQPLNQLITNFIIKDKWRTTLVGASLPFRIPFRIPFRKVLKVYLPYVPYPLRDFPVRGGTRKMSASPAYMSRDSPSPLVLLPLTPTSTPSRDTVLI